MKKSNRVDEKSTLLLCINFIINNIENMFDYNKNVV